MAIKLTQSVATPRGSFGVGDIISGPKPWEGRMLSAGFAEKASAAEGKDAVKFTDKAGETAEPNKGAEYSSGREKAKADK